MDLLLGFDPVWLIVKPSTSWDRLFRYFEECRVDIGGILVDTGDRLGVSEFPEALPDRFLVVPTGRHFSCIGVDLLGKGQDYRFVLVVTASKLLIDYSFGNLLDVVCGNIRSADCFTRS